MVDMGFKLLFSGLAITLAFVAFVPYVRSILKGRTRPHVFSWFIWGITTVIVFLAQLEADGGVGAWPIGISGVLTVAVAVLAFINARISASPAPTGHSLLRHWHRCRSGT